MGSDGKLGYANALTFLGDVALNCDDVGQARSLYEESVAVLRAPGDINFLAYSIRRLGQLAWREGYFSKAVALCTESLALNQEVGDPRGTIACLAGFAAIAVAQGKWGRSAKLMAAVEVQLSLIGIQLLYMDKFEYERNRAVLHTQLDKKDLDIFWATGKVLTLDQAIEFALADTKE